MASVMLPKRVLPPKKIGVTRSCPGHRAWVRRHHCSVPECKRLPIECAHVRCGQDGGVGLKPADKWVISLCAYHHREQHQIGQRSFENKYSIDMLQLAAE